VQKVYLYLGGPITGIKYKKANQWRELVKSRLPKWIVCVSPMRHENPLARGKLGIIKNQSEEYVLKYQKRITSCCRNDIKRCDIIFLNLLGIKMVSIGTIIELGWADMLGKHIVVAMRRHNIHHHVMTREIPDIVVDNLQEAIDMIIKMAKRIQKQKQRREQKSNLTKKKKENIDNLL
jgi:nucleoside 2-deoxyribosyltransferase